MQLSVYVGQVTKAYQYWLDDMPAMYANKLLGTEGAVAPTVADDPMCSLL